MEQDNSTTHVVLYSNAWPSPAMQCSEEEYFIDLLDNYTGDQTDNFLLALPSLPTIYNGELDLIWYLTTLF